MKNKLREELEEIGIDRKLDIVCGGAVNLSYRVQHDEIKEAKELAGSIVAIIGAFMSVDDMASCAARYEHAHQLAKRMTITLYTDVDKETN